MSTGYYFNAYYKWLLGWIEPKILTNENSPEETVELSPVESIDEGADGCYKAVVLVPDPSLLPFTEFFIAEYRIGGTGYDPPAWYENGTRVEFPETPGIILWHCNTELNSVRQYQYSDSYLLPVYKSGKSRDPNKQNNNIYRARDLYGINDVFSSTTRVNSDFYNNFYTGAYLKVENMVAEKAILQAGFRDPDLTPGPVLHLSQPSLKATKNTLVTYTLTITEGVGGKSYLLKN